MSKKQKYYVVWEGHKIGIVDSWTKCQLAIKGYPAAKYKSFETLSEAKKAFDDGPEAHWGKGKSKKKKVLTAAEKAKYGEPNLYSISVDAASSGNPGKMEYQGVDTQTGKRLFRQGIFPLGTNNVGEFLALVHGLAYLKKKGSDRLLYTDSKIAMSWVRQKKCKTKLVKNKKSAEMFELVRRAEDWLKKNSYSTKIVKWETKAWGEIPADFGRK